MYVRALGGLIINLCLLTHSKSSHFFSIISQFVIALHLHTTDCGIHSEAGQIEFVNINTQMSPLEA